MSAGDLKKRTEKRNRPRGGVKVVDKTGERQPHPKKKKEIRTAVRAPRENVPPADGETPEN